MGSLRVGIDLVPVGEVEDSLHTHGDRYLRRIYTPREVEESRRRGDVCPERLAARFAAKEAVMKVLRPSAGEALPWRAIEVRRAPGGWTEVGLSGGAAAAAARQGLGPMSVSLSHAGAYAAAVAVSAGGAS